MESKCVLVWLYIACILVHLANAWFFGDTDIDAVGEHDDSDSVATEATPLSIRSYPFEIKTADDKFLLEAHIAKELSVLDACHHRVVSELEGRCSDMSEEDLSKLSVHLFNCQAAVEHRPTYSCTSDMAISDCTRDMDSTTWNAYQIVSNRARSICYGVKQQQFRAQAELTVNRLMASSEHQLSTLATIADTQEQLKAMADSTVEKLEASHQQIVRDQQQLHRAHRSMNTQVLRNLEQLLHEKEIVAAGNEQLIAKTEEIKQKLDSTAQQINDQSSVQSTRHKEILTDLAVLGSQAEDVSSKLDASSTAVEKFHASVIEHERVAIENLKQINSTVNFLLSLFNNVHDSLESKLEWVLFLLGVSNKRTTAVLVIATHLCYAVIGLVVFSLMRVKQRVRCMMMVIILLNAAGELRCNRSFGSMELSIVMLAVGFCEVLLSWCWATLVRRSATVQSAVQQQLAVSNCSHILSNEDIKYVIKALEQLSDTFTRRFSDSDVQASKENDDILVATSTPRRPLPEVELESLNDPRNSRVFQFPLHSTPPPVIRHSLPCMPPNPPPTPFLDGGSAVHCDGVLNLSDSPISSASCSGTPRKGGKKGRNSSILNRSISRPLCIAVTKSGQPCKLPSQEGSDFCHRHQIE